MVSMEGNQKQKHWGFRQKWKTEFVECDNTLNWIQYILYLYFNKWEHLSIVCEGYLLFTSEYACNRALKGSTLVWLTCSLSACSEYHLWTCLCSSPEPLSHHTEPGRETQSCFPLRLQLWPEPDRGQTGPCCKIQFCQLGNWAGLAVWAGQSSWPSWS